jgi:GNAT superfamily N-acetyltransferase
VEILETLELGSSSVVLRRAGAGDLPAIVDLIAADQLGATRDGVKSPEDLAAYQAAFEAIDRDPAHLLIVAQSGPDIVATMQLSFLPGLARRGALRAQIEAVRVHRAYRNNGLGAALFTWAIGESRRRHCALVQLTTDKSRTAAHRFYERLGFAATHDGMKLSLRESDRPLCGVPRGLEDTDPLDDDVLAARHEDRYWQAVTPPTIQPLPDTFTTSTRSLPDRNVTP